MKTKVILAGDSTVKTYDPADAPQAGWGQFIGNYFNDELIFLNHAMGGRSTRTFIEENRLEAILQELKEDDYLFIQMGHNDSAKNKPERYTDPQTDFKSNLKIYIDRAREKKGNPLLITPVSRLKYEDGQFHTDLKDYCEAMKEVAIERKVPLVDLNTRSLELYSALGYEETRKLFMVSVKGSDYTHFTETGANKIAKLVADEIKGLKMELSKYAKKE